MNNAKKSACIMLWRVSSLFSIAMQVADPGVTKLFKWRANTLWRDTGLCNPPWCSEAHKNCTNIWLLYTTDCTSFIFITRKFKHTLPALRQLNAKKANSSKNSWQSWENHHMATQKLAYAHIPTQILFHSINGFGQWANGPVCSPSFVACQPNNKSANFLTSFMAQPQPCLCNTSDWKPAFSCDNSMNTHREYPL